MDNNSEQEIGMDENCAEQIIETKTENAELKNEGMEEMSTSMDNALDDGNTEQKSNKKSLKFGGWLPDVLDWFKRPKLAQTSLSTSSYIMNRYCWPKLHGKVKPRTVRTLIFLNDWHNGNWRTILIVKRGDLLFDGIPIADIEPPKYIGFEQINFQSINDRALQFVEKILPLLKEDVQMNFACGKIVNNPQIGPIKRLMELLASKTNKLEIFGSKDVNKFNEQFPGFIIGVQSIRLYQCTKSEADWLMEWLNAAPREDGTPKILQIVKHNSRANAKALIDRVKEEFVRSTEPANFIIHLIHDALIGYEDFKTVNEATKEILELQCKNRNKYFYVRRKIDGQATPKIDDLKKQMKLESKTIIRIDINY